MLPILMLCLIFASIIVLVICKFILFVFMCNFTYFCIAFTVCNGSSKLALEEKII